MATRYATDSQKFAAQSFNELGTVDNEVVIMNIRLLYCRYC